ncbi:MAG: PEGA domain-containing protein [Eubacteriales bacterium]
MSGTKEITVAQKQEVRLDVSEFNGDSASVGQVVFIITPADAVVTIDGVEVDVSQVLEYEYGIHQMIIEADGYQTITQFVKVGAPSASISIAMELLEEEEDTVSSNSVTSDEVLDTSLDGYVVRIEGPTGAQVYVDSVYVGVAPISFPKVEGEHSLILAMEGYETRTYTIQIDGEEKDVAFAFSELTLSE